MQVELENSSAMTVSNSASGDASVSSSGQQPAPPPATTKRKRNLPGMPDPNSEVIALSPKTLMATNRFVCEICSKGFQRDQNLQLHRRGHNLPWKLRQRPAGKEAPRKRVYVCPEPTCVHHDPSRALGDLTGIKKHFSRKHGEKKWKCEKCSKKYAVQSDWKAHSKTCGTREYRCDCGTLFSRRDSFITHRAFCDALAEESAKAKTTAVEAAPAANSETADDDRKTVEVLTAASSPPSLAVVPAVSPLRELPTVAEEQQQQQQQELDNTEPAAVPHYIPPPPPPLPPRPLIAGNSSNGSGSNDIDNMNHKSSSSSNNNKNTNCSSSASTSLFASLFASAAASTVQSSTFSDLIGAMSRPNGGTPAAAATAAAPHSLSLTSLCLFPNGPTLFSAPHDQLSFIPQQPPSPHLSATALLQKAAQMGAAATNTSLLRGFGLVSSTSTSLGQTETLQENYQLRHHHHHSLEPEPTGLSSAALGLGLLPSYDNRGPVLPDLMMGPSSLFGQRPATFDFLGLGMAPGGSPAGGLSALITSIGSGLDVAASAGRFGAGNTSGKAWESADG